MIVRVREWYGARSLREQRLLLLMSVVALPVLAWLLVVAPLSRTYDEALERHLEAVDRNGRVRALAAVPRAAAGTAAPTQGADLGLVITDTASQSGLTLASNTPSGSDAVAVTLGPASPTPVAQWLSALEERGIRVEELRMTPAGDGTVNASARLARGTP